MGGSKESWRARWRGLRLLASAALLLGPAACSGADEQRASQTAPSRTATPTPAEDGCARVISAIGWADFVLVPPGRERSQDFEPGVRGRIAYVEGTVVIFGEYLPERAVAPAQELRRQAHRTVDVDATRAEQVRGLERYHDAVAEVKRACADRSDG